jgi:outer membrane protein OmpA-like peptidoglycan-associated protein
VTIVADSVAFVRESSAGANMSNRIGTIARVATTLAIAVAAPSAQTQDENWGFEISPYLWAAGIDADVTVANQTVNIKRDFSDIVDALDIGGGIMAGAGINRFVAVTQVDYVSLDSDELDEAPARGRLESKTLFAMLALGYRFGGETPGKHFDVLLGARNLSLENTLTLDGLGSFKGDNDFVDPILMLRPSLPLGRRWRLNATLSYGTGGDSEKTWELQPQVQFQISDHLAARFGYRRLHYDIRAENGRNRFDGAFEGLVLGLGGTFGGTPGRRMRASEPAPAPAPAPAATAASAPPAPSPPPAPRDTDADGITDNIDKCPNTARGEKVDPVGCAYNVRLNVLFATNSATLQSESGAELDRIVAALNSTPTLFAIIEGHTDSTGPAAYNQSLSERRAKSVADYLMEHGVNSSRLQWKGYGASQPIADNTTAEGRAQNRRVVLRRPDAD